MELQHLKAFYEVALCGSISAASKKMRITQPAVSRAVRSLEHSIDRKLFDRKPRGVALTSEGQRVFEQCELIFRACGAIESGASRPSDNVRIAASENLCLHLFPDVLAQKALRETLLGAEVEISSGTSEDVAREVLNGTSDYGYCYHAFKGPGILSEPLAKVPFVIVCSPRIASRTVSLKQLEKLPLIGSRSRDYRELKGSYAAKSLLSLAGLSAVRASLQSNSQEAQVALASAGLGYAVVPWFVAKPRIQSKELIELHSPRALSAPLFRLTRQGSRPSEFFEIFEDLLVKRVEGI